MSCRILPFPAVIVLVFKILVSSECYFFLKNHIKLIESRQCFETCERFTLLLEHGLCLYTSTSLIDLDIILYKFVILLEASSCFIYITPEKE